MYIKLLNFNNICNTFVGYAYPGGLSLLSLLSSHARLHGCAGSSCPEQNNTANPNCMLIVNHLSDSGPDRNDLKYIYIYIYIYTHTCICVKPIYVFVYTYTCIYIYFSNCLLEPSCSPSEASRMQVWKFLLFPEGQNKCMSFNLDD